MDQRIIDLYDRFTHGGISRRDFLDRLAGLTGSSAAATALLPFLANDYARAATLAFIAAGFASVFSMIGGTAPMRTAFETRLLPCRPR